MKTIKVSNGDIVKNEGDGTLATVDGVEKAAQDLARHILSKFSPEFQEGSEVVVVSEKNASILNDALASQFIMEAVNRLIQKQSRRETNRIIKVQRLRTRVVGLSTLVFMLEVLFSDGGVRSIVEKVAIKPVSLDHLFDSNGILSI